MNNNHADILRLARERFKTARDSDKDERREAYDDICFAVNDNKCQWPETIRRSREEDDPPRPCLVLNKIPEKIDQVDGEFRQLKPSIKLRGVDSKADPKIAEILAGIIRHIEYNSNANSAYNTAHGSVLFCGRGAWRIDIEDAEDDPFIRDIVINRIPNVFTVYWDPAVKKEDKSDARYVFITEELSEDEFKAQWPDISVQDWDVSNEALEGWREEKTIRIAEYWWKERYDKTYYQVNRRTNGMPTVLTTSELTEGDEILEEKTIQQDRVHWCKMTADQILPVDGRGKDGKIYEWPSKYIPIIIETGKEVNIKGQSKSRGMVRFAKIPQQMYNYWSSAVTEQIALAPKSPYLVTGKMIGPHQSQWDQSNIKNYPYLLYDVDPLAPTLYPKREMPPQLSSAIAYELNRMEHDIMGAMGIYHASLGDEGQEISGRAILARQKQGSIGSYTYVDKFQTALIYSAKILIDLIPYVYDTERIIRIRGEDDTEKTVPINTRANAPFMDNFQNLSEDLLSEPREGVTEYINDLTVGKYDVIATIGPSYTTQRQEAVAMLMDLVAAVPQAGLAAIDLIVKNIDLPGADELVNRLKKLVPPGIRDLEPDEKEAEAPPDPKMMIEMQKLQFQAQEQMRKDFEARINAIKTIAEAQSVERKQDLEAVRAILEDIRSEFLSTTQSPQPSPQEQQLPIEG